MTADTIEGVQALGAAIEGEVAKVVFGQQDLTRMVTIALLAGGHVLLEGPPGTAKTLLAQAFARAVGLDFGRIQFTPDLMPGDILGSNLFNFQTSSFTLTKGPIFTELLLADEINRTPPKTQAALLEAMQERRVTINGEPHPMSPRFTVLATQNPIEQQGVYPLPEAQLDRFLFKLVVDYPDADEERRIVAEHGGRFKSPVVADFGVGQVADLECGASPRAASLLARAACAAAALDGRDYVIPDDVQRLAGGVLRHRVILSAAAEIEGRGVEQVVAALLDRVDVPR